MKRDDTNPVFNEAMIFSVPAIVLQVCPVTPWGPQIPVLVRTSWDGMGVIGTVVVHIYGSVGCGGMGDGHIWKTAVCVGINMYDFGVLMMQGDG